MKITQTTKVKFEYSRFDTTKEGCFYADCSFEEATPNLIFVFDTVPFQFKKPDWFPQVVMMSINNRKTKNPIGTDQALTVIDLFLDKNNHCNCDANLFDLKAPDFRKSMQNVTPLNLLLRC